MTMSFQAGAMNVGALMSCHRFVTHTTGLFTTFGTEIAKGSWLTAIGFFILPFFFLIGAMTSGYFIDHRIQTNQAPLYPVAMGLSFLTLVFVLGGGHFGLFGAFGSDLDLLKHFILLVALAFTSGLINGTVTSACGAVIRITHMTGLTTDLGLGLMRVLTRTHKLNSRENEIRANINRICIIGSFCLGAGVGAVVFAQLGYLGFLVPCLLAFLLFGWSLRRYSQSNQKSQLQFISQKEMINQR